MSNQGKAATLDQAQHKTMLEYLSDSRHSKRNTAIYLLTYRAGLRIGTVAGLRLDDVIDSYNINRDLYDLIKLASPYGQGNPEPQFIIKNAKIDYWSEVGTGHLKVKLSNANYGNIDAIAFGAKGTVVGDLLMNHSGGLFHIAGVIKKNDWQGNKAVQFHIKDLFTA